MGKKAVPTLPHLARAASSFRHAEMAADARAALADDAAYGLARAMPSLSAHIVITAPQVAALLFAAVAATALSTFWPQTMWSALVALLSFGFVAGTLFRAGLACLGGWPRATPHASDGEPLPVYTILVPLFREANVLPHLARALMALDYPRDKLDIKIIVEEDDSETGAVAAEVAGNAPFEIVCVPAGRPQTKPRACNYALNFARGEFTVIFDAEDRPERDQLRKAAAAFRASPSDTACLQARLNFYNADENWLTRLFALDYALWFDVLLPGLDRLGVPMPLGGTSNHFRTAVLRQLGGWDPFNVTEDADLGIRIAHLGKRVAMLDSTTFEEAPVHFRVWLKQRSRWLKGYMQTWLVHTRRPLSLIHRAGLGGFLAFHLFVGGAVLSALAAPLLWALFAWSLFGPAHSGLSLSASSLIGGNALLTVLAMAGPLRRGWRDLAPYGLTATLYWALISLAALRGLGQLITNPFYWEKTAHGLSRQAAD